MLSFPPSTLVRIFVARESIDMRKGIDGLAGLVIARIESFTADLSKVVGAAAPHAVQEALGSPVAAPVRRGSGVAPPKTAALAAPSQGPRRGIGQFAR